MKAAPRGRKQEKKTMENGKILASVAGNPITEEDVTRFIAALGERGSAYNNPEGRKMVLEELIAHRLFLAEAKKNLFEVRPEFKKRLADIKDRLLVDYAMEEALGKITATEADAKKYYDEHASEMTSGETVNASHILVADEETAQAILAKIRAGETSFEDAARENSTCPSGKEGGMLGDFGKGQMVPEFEEACFTMEVGAISEPVKTQFGYHIIRLDSKKAAEPMHFGDVREGITRQLMMDKQRAAYQSKLNQLKILYPVDRM